MADALVDEMQSGGGLITHQDLAAYTPVWRAPVRFSYRGMRLSPCRRPVPAASRWRSFCKAREAYDIAALGHNSAAHIHMMTELQRRTYADRATHLGDMILCGR